LHRLWSEDSLSTETCFLNEIVNKKCYSTFHLYAICCGNKSWNWNRNIISLNLKYFPVYELYVQFTQHHVYGENVERITCYNLISHVCNSTSSYSIRHKELIVFRSRKSFTTRTDKNLANIFSSKLPFSVIRQFIFIL
jgi:hypothetical protein